MGPGEVSITLQITFCHTLLYDTSFVLVHETLPSIYFCRCFGASFSGKNVLWGWRRGWIEWKGSFFMLFDLFLQVFIWEQFEEMVSAGLVQRTATKKN